MNFGENPAAFNATGLLIYLATGSYLRFRTAENRRTTRLAVSAVSFLLTLLRRKAMTIPIPMVFC